MGKENNFKVDTTEDASNFTENNLRKYKAVIFLHTTGDVLDDQQQVAFQKYIQAGGGYLGIHAAADTEYAWPWYGQLAGAYFKSHPKQQQASLKQVSKMGASSLPAQWSRWDEWYNYKEISPDIKVLYYLDESTYEGGENGAQHPIIWYHNFDGGRSFYIGIGHTDESYTDPLFLTQLKEGVFYASGIK